LTRAVADYLTGEDIHVLGRLSFWVTIYFNKAVLASVLERRELCSPEKLDAFIMGFSQSSPRFILVDVGYGKDATFTKITGQYMIPQRPFVAYDHLEYLQTYSRFPQTQRIFFAGKFRHRSMPFT